MADVLSWVRVSIQNFEKREKEMPVSKRRKKNGVVVASRSRRVSYRKKGSFVGYSCGRYPKE